MDSMIGVIIAIVGSTGFWTVLSTVVANRKNRKTPQSEMLLAMGRDRLLFLAKKHLKNGFIPEDEYEAFTKLGDAYLRMGGNSIVKKLYTQALDLEVKEE